MNGKYIGHFQVSKCDKNPPEVAIKIMNVHIFYQKSPFEFVLLPAGLHAVELKKKILKPGKLSMWFLSYLKRSQTLYKQDV